MCGKRMEGQHAEPEVHACGIGARACEFLCAHVPEVFACAALPRARAGTHSAAPGPASAPPATAPRAGRRAGGRPGSRTSGLTLHLRSPKAERWKARACACCVGACVAVRPPARAPNTQTPPFGPIKPISHERAQGLLRSMPSSQPLARRRCMRFEHAARTSVFAAHSDSALFTPGVSKEMEGYGDSG